MLKYTLTSYGEEYFETLLERLKKEHAKRDRGDGTFKPMTSLGYKLSRQYFLLDKIRRGEDPSTWTTVTPEIATKYPGKAKIANEADRKELALMASSNLIRTTSTSSHHSYPTMLSDYPEFWQKNE